MFVEKHLLKQVKKMRKEREEYLEIMRRLDGDWPGRAAAKKYVHDSDCYIYGLPAPFSFVPAFYTDEELAFFSGVCEMTHRILAKVIAYYVQNEAYRQLFAFPADVERLIMLPCNYEEMLPMARFDFFLNEEDRSFKFCEFNADGAAAMSRTKIGCEALTLSETFRDFSEKHPVKEFEMFDSWVDAFLKTYRSDKNAVEKPNILITDFSESVTMSDVTRYLAAFNKRGLKARFVDIEDLAYDERGLFDPVDGLVFQAVYRRAVTSDVFAHMDRCKALIDAVAAEKVCLIGHFRTTVVHSKMINVALLDPMTKAILSEEEWLFVLEHVLPAYRLQSDTADLDLEAVKNRKDDWIIKPEDDYDSHGVYAGKDMTEEAWKETVAKCLDRHFVVMRYHTPCQCEIALPYRDETAEDPHGIEKYYSMTGIYSFNGKHHGFFSRMGKEGVISESHNGVSIPSFRIL